ncbi:MAG: hypothetical protein HW380_277 [Magnetococcales bacterium]|nr:hypothetical protein [Magnetococcales bacterium]HIJ83298.1 hypothetical protein [Magnetococcales bacterium]
MARIFKSLQGRDRPWNAVPKPVWWLALVALALHLTLHAQHSRPGARAEALPVSPGQGVLRLLALGDPVAMNRLAMLWLQAFDYQSGVSVAFKDLDPHRLRQWLVDIIALDPRSQYPLMAASRFYADIPREDTQRILSDFVYEQFHDDPNRRWPWLGHVAIIAKHRLHDLPLALKYARAIRSEATGTAVPSWVRQMEMVFLEDMGELEQARLFIGGLLASQQVSEPEEIHFLNQRLEELEAREKEIGGKGRPVAERE